MLCMPLVQAAPVLTVAKEYYSMAMLLGKKIGMTRLYDDSGKIMPVTVIQAGPCTVLQVKKAETDGYNAVQMGFEDVKAGRVKKPAAGHAAKANTAAKRYIRQWRLAEGADCPYSAGDRISVSVLADVKFVDIVGTSKGKGFAGVMKRHGFGGFPASHGTERKHRAPGSQSGHGTDRGHGGNIKKGKRMGGRMGGCRVTTSNHRLVSVDQEKNLVIVKGAVAGPAGGYVVIRPAKTRS